MDNKIRSLLTILGLVIMVSLLFKANIVGNAIFSYSELVPIQNEFNEIDLKFEEVSDFRSHIDDTVFDKRLEVFDLIERIELSTDDDSKRVMFDDLEILFDEYKIIVPTINKIKEESHMLTSSAGLIEGSESVIMNVLVEKKIITYKINNLKVSQITINYDNSENLVNYYVMDIYGEDIENYVFDLRPNNVGSDFFEWYVNEGSFKVSYQIPDVVNDVGFVVIKAGKCGDGIKNADEEGIDCGGEFCYPCLIGSDNNEFFEIYMVLMIIIGVVVFALLTRFIIGSNIDREIRKTKKTMKKGSYDEVKRSYEEVKYVYSGLSKKSRKRAHKKCLKLHSEIRTKFKI